jgi:hypothetical protein
MALVVILWFVNLGISIWNAYAVGRAWVESKHAGGFSRLVAWAGAAMSALGFTWCYLSVLSALGAGLGWWSANVSSAALSLGYIVIAIGVLSSGAVIVLDSWASAYRRRSFAGFGVAGYNTFAEMNNAYNAVSGLPAAFHAVISTLRSGDRDRSRGASGVVLGLVLFVLFGGIITTGMIIEHVAGSGEPLAYQGGRQLGHA